MSSLTVYKKYLRITAIAWGGCLVLFVAAYIVLLKPQSNSKQHLEKKLSEKIQEHKDAERRPKNKPGSS